MSCCAVLCRAVRRFRQYLFASQSRLLLRLGRPGDVAEKGLRFIGAVAAELGQRERSPEGGVRPMFKEVRWRRWRRSLRS